MSTDFDVSPAADDHIDTGPTPATGVRAGLVDQIFAIGVLAGGLSVVLAARRIALRNETPGIDARTWPTLIGWCIVITSTWIIFNAFTGRRTERDVEVATRAGWWQAVMTVSLTAVLLSVWYAGVSLLYLVPGYLIGVNLIFGVRNLKALLIFPILITSFVYLVFHLILKVPL